MAGRKAHQRTTARHFGGLQRRVPCPTKWTDGLMAQWHGSLREL